MGRYSRVAGHCHKYTGLHRDTSAGRRTVRREIWWLCILLPWHGTPGFISLIVFVTLLIQFKCSNKCCYTDENVWSKSQENCSKTLNVRVRYVRPGAWLVKTASQFVTSLVSAVMMVLVMFWCSDVSQDTCWAELSGSRHRETETRAAATIPPPAGGWNWWNQ